MTRIKHPYISNLFHEVDEKAVAEWVAAGWVDQSRKTPRESAKKSAPKQTTNPPATEGNSENQGELSNG